MGDVCVCVLENVAKCINAIARKTDELTFQHTQEKKPPRTNTHPTTMNMMNEKEPQRNGSWND